MEERKELKELRKKLRAGDKKRFRNDVFIEREIPEGFLSAGKGDRAGFGFSRNSKG